MPLITWSKKKSGNGFVYQCDMVKQKIVEKRGEEQTGVFWKGKQFDTVEAAKSAVYVSLYGNKIGKKKYG